MLKTRHAVFGFAILIASFGDSSAQSQGPPERSGVSESQPPQAEVGSTQNQTTAEEIAKRQREEQENKAFNENVTLVIAALTLGALILQWLAFVCQAIFIRRSVTEMGNQTKATIQAARATEYSTNLMLERSQKIERAYMSGGGMRQQELFDLSANGIPRFRETGNFEFHVNNYGKTPGTLYKLGYGFCEEQDIPSHPTYEFVYRHNPIDPGRRGEPIYRHPIPTELKSPVVYGRFYYKTIFETRHSSGFIYRILPNRAPESISPPSNDYIKDQDEHDETE
jgi:hypothetical protein